MPYRFAPNQIHGTPAEPATSHSCAYNSRYLKRTSDQTIEFGESVSEVVGGSCSLSLGNGQINRASCIP